jgi:hypothetical protein
MSLDKFANMLEFGINLKLSGKQEEKYYAQRLRFYLMEMELFDAESEDDINIDIYYCGEKSLIVNIEDSVLSFEPVSESSYDCIMGVLSFVSYMHDNVQQDFKKLGEIEVEHKPALVREEDSSEEESSEDMEWI